MKRSMCTRARHHLPLLRQHSGTHEWLRWSRHRKRRGKRLFPGFHVGQDSAEDDESHEISVSLR